MFLDRGCTSGKASGDYACIKQPFFMLRACLLVDVKLYRRYRSAAGSLALFLNIWIFDNCAERAVVFFFVFCCVSGLFLFRSCGALCGETRFVCFI